ncbi:MAG: hypothetical protein ABSF15_25480 [Candidatus Sulfotelmatobacter sp.]|jgi:hypothetical protein
MNSVPLLFFFLLLPFHVLAQEIGTVSLVEGPLRLIRGATVLRGAAGVRLRQGDIIESSETGFAQLEFTGGTIVALGASTRLFLLRYAPARPGDSTGGKSTAAELIVLRGWLKGETNSSLGPYCYASPVLAATTSGTIVLHAAADGAEVFVETGSAEVSETSHDGARSHADSASAGQFLSRRAGKDITVDSRPDPAFLASIPRPFRDTLPSRMSIFSGRAVPAKPEHEVSYAEIQPWLTIGKPWRKGFVERFQSRLGDPAFRKALEDHLDEHPEWDPVLHPDKYPPKPTASAEYSFGFPNGGC